MKFKKTHHEIEQTVESDGFDSISKEDKYTIRNGNLFAKAVNTNYSWSTYERDLEYRDYSNDDEIYIPMNNINQLCNCQKVFIKDVSTDRYSELGTDIIEVKLNEGEKFTEYTMLRSIRDYYHKNLSDEELSKIAYLTDDGWGYNKKALRVLTKRETQPNYILKRHEIMGDKTWFELLIPDAIKNGAAIYKLYIGS